MVLSTQVANKDRQSASLYPFPLTPILGFVNFASASIVFGILVDFVYELRGGKMAVPFELIVALGASLTSVTQQITSWIRQRFTVYSAKQNLYLHAVVLLFWIAAFALLSYRLGNMVLGHACTLALWQTEMGLMVCRMYKAMYSFATICLLTSMAHVALDWVVMKETKSSGAYRALADPSPYVGTFKTPEIGSEKSPMIGN